MVWLFVTGGIGTRWELVVGSVGGRLVAAAAGGLPAVGTVEGSTEVEPDPMKVTLDSHENELACMPAATLVTTSATLSATTFCVAATGLEIAVGEKKNQRRGILEERVCGGGSGVFASIDKMDSLKMTWQEMIILLEAKSRHR